MIKRPVDPCFIEYMEAKLQEGREKGKKAWDEEWDNYNTSLRQLFDMLLDEVQELFNELTDKNSTPDDIAKEAADVANFAMMIADRAGGLK